MANGYFYTLSAIAQSFAAIISLYAIFMIYKFRSIRDERNSSFEKLRELRLKQLTLRRRDREFYDGHYEFVYNTSDAQTIKWAKNGSGSNDIPRRKEEIANNIEKLDKFSKQLIYLLKVILILNGVTIAFSLICLPWGNFLPTALPVLVLVIALSLGLVALYRTIKAIWFTITGL